MAVTHVELTLAVREVTLAVQNYRLRAAQVGFGIGAMEMMALSQLFTGGPSTPSGLAKFLSITTPSATQLVDRLEAGGHLTRARHPSDRRKVVVDLTPRARDRIGAMFARTGQATEHAARHLSSTQQDTVWRFLTDVALEYQQVDPAEAIEGPRPCDSGRRFSTEPESGGDGMADGSTGNRGTGVAAAGAG